jgi:hypothetical protein
MTKVKALIFAVALALPMIASAGEFGIQVHTNSLVLADRSVQNWTETTPGLGVRYSFNKEYAVQAGRYRNEQSTDALTMYSNYAYGDWTPVSKGVFSFGAFAGLVTGYGDVTVKRTVTPAPCPPGTPTSTVSSSVKNDNSVAPTFGLVARAEYKQFNVTVRLRPELTQAGPATLMTEVGFKF